MNSSVHVCPGPSGFLTRALRACRSAAARTTNRPQNRAEYTCAAAPARLGRWISDSPDHRRSACTYTHAIAGAYACNRRGFALTRVDKEMRTREKERERERETHASRSATLSSRWGKSVLEDAGRWYQLYELWSIDLCEQSTLPWQRTMKGEKATYLAHLRNGMWRARVCDDLTPSRADPKLAYYMGTFIRKRPQLLIRSFLCVQFLVISLYNDRTLRLSDAFAV